MAGASRSRRRALRALMAAAAGCLALVASAAEPQKKDAEPPQRWYAGINLGSLDFRDTYAGVGLHDTSVGLGVFGGAYLKERLSLELSYDSFTAIDLRDVAGSGVTHFDVKTERRTVALAVVREVSMRDIFEWRRDWRFFGVAGVYRSDLDRSVTMLPASEPLRTADRIDGVLLGGGVLYRLGPVDLRGYFREFGMLEDKEGHELGVVVQRKF